jgi:gliding motility-associated-like protein/uncharacterized repeat protein (TIGR01451 family)
MAPAALAQSAPVTRYIVPGQQVKLTATQSAAPAYQWYRDGVPVGGGRRRELVTALPGTYTVQAYYRLECPSEHSAPVVIKEMPDGGAADLFITKQSDRPSALADQQLAYLLTVTNNGPQAAAGVVVTDVLPRQLLLENVGTPSSGTASYNAATHTVTWQVGSLGLRQQAILSITTKIREAGELTNTATVTSALRDTVPGNNKAVHVQRVLPLFIPNAITPNGDGLNDHFRMPGLDAYPENELSIYNRWGNMVFTEKNYRQRWDGKGLNEGTYFYVLRIRDAGGRWQNFKGWVIIMR